MDYAGRLGGGFPWIESVRIGATVIAGVPIKGALDGASGAVTVTNSTFVDIIGVTQEAVTYVTAQQTDGSDADRTVKTIINPDAVYKAKLSGGSTEDTALPVATVDTADSTGLSVETDLTMTNYDNGTIWGLSGANKGRVRKIDEISGAHASVLVPFEAIAVGDTFLVSSLHQFGLAAEVELTDLFTQVLNTGAVSGHVEVSTLRLITEGRNDSFALLVWRDMVFNVGVT